MNNKNYQVYFDCGSSKIRAAACDNNNSKNNFQYEGEIFFDKSKIKFEIQKIVSLLEKKNKEYLNEINLMIDSSDMLSIGISVSGKLDGSELKKEDVQFLVQDANQQILKNYTNQNITHIIINNYKVDNVDYDFLPNNLICNLISIDILFICIPKKTIEYFKTQFLELDISINQIFCSSYAKSVNYKDNFSSINDISFIDIGFNKTSVTCFNKNKIIFLDVLPIGGNHITKDISKVLKINLKEAEKAKLYFDDNQNFLNDKKISLDLIQKIIFARIEEILELCAKSIELNLKITKQSKRKMVLMGEGSKILDNRFKEKISFLHDVDLLDETVKDIFDCALNLYNGINKQEVVLIPKKSIKEGFFEKLFHLFR
tara:strand:+ start:1774 stop:2889 length:1116 start_codon:yes stop_codon:yes gene_type:complete